MLRCLNTQRGGETKPKNGEGNYYRYIVQQMCSAVNPPRVKNRPETIHKRLLGDSFCILLSGVGNLRELCDSIRE